MCGLPAHGRRGLVTLFVCICFLMALMSSLRSVFLKKEWQKFKNRTMLQPHGPYSRPAVLFGPALAGFHALNFKGSNEREYLGLINYADTYVGIPRWRGFLGKRKGWNLFIRSSRGASTFIRRCLFFNGTHELPCGRFS